MLKQKINNNKYNKPIIDVVLLIVATLLMVGILMVYILFFGGRGSTSPHERNYWYGWAGNIFFRTLFPIFAVTFHHKDFRGFITKTWHDFWSNNKISIAVIKAGSMGAVAPINFHINPI